MNTKRVGAQNNSTSMINKMREERKVDESYESYESYDSYELLARQLDIPEIFASNSAFINSFKSFVRDICRYSNNGDLRELFDKKMSKPKLLRSLSATEIMFLNDEIRSTHFKSMTYEQAKGIMESPDVSAYQTMYVGSQNGRPIVTFYDAKSDNKSFYGTISFKQTFSGYLHSERYVGKNNNPLLEVSTNWDNQGDMLNSTKLYYKVLPAIRDMAQKNILKQ